MKAYRTHKLAAEDPLSASSVNKTLKILAQILDDAIDDRYLATNPTRGRKTRVRAPKPKRTWLELDEVRSLLDAAGTHRALLATMILGGLCVSELCSLRWRAVDLARPRSDVHDGAAPLDQVRQRELGRQKCAGQVDPDRLLPLLERFLEHRSAGRGRPRC